MYYIKDFQDFITESSNSTEKALKKKSSETGAPVGILRKVFNRGLAAWKSGHKPGAGQQQWAYARVNSFTTGAKGTWRGADADLAKKARDAGFNPKESEIIQSFEDWLFEKDQNHPYFKGLSQSTARKKKNQMEKQAKMPDDDPDAYKKLPGDVAGKKHLKTSKHTNKYHELYGSGSDSQ